MTYKARCYVAAILIILIPSLSFAKRVRSHRSSSEQSEEVNSAEPVQAPSVQSTGGNTGNAGPGTSDAVSATRGSSSSSPTQIYVWKDKKNVLHAVNNLSDVPPGYKTVAPISTDLKQPVVQLVPDGTQPEATDPSRKRAGKNVRQSSMPTRHTAGHAQERQPDFREKQKRR